MLRQLDATGTTAALGPDAVFPATRVVHESLDQAVAAARAFTGGAPDSRGTDGGGTDGGGTDGGGTDGGGRVPPPG